MKKDLLKYISVFVVGFLGTTIIRSFKKEKYSDFTSDMDIVPNSQGQPNLNIVISVGKEGGKAILFGRNKFMSETNYGSSNGVKVSSGIGSVSYGEIIQQSATNPFKAKGFRVMATKEELLRNSRWQYVYKDANGQMASIPISIERYMSPQNYTNRVVDVPLEIEINGENYIEIDFPKGLKGSVKLLLF